MGDNDKQYGADHHDNDNHHVHVKVLQHLPQPTRRKRQTTTTTTTTTTTQCYDGFLVPDHDKEDNNDNHRNDIAPFQYEYHTVSTFEAKYQLHTIKIGDLVWVSKSKGLKKKKSCHYNTNDGGGGDSNTDDKQQQRQRTGGELFLRAHVLQCSHKDEGGGRALVQYPKGSTYHVRCDLVTPIFDSTRQLQQNTGIVVAISETHDYRRYCHLHTSSDDTFLEIGCAFGDTCERIRCSIEEETSNCRVLGVDKSLESITIAQERFPNNNFVVVEDVLENSNQLKEVCDLYLKSPPTVVAIDINGSRDLPAVLQCIQIVMNLWITYDKEVTLPTPRLMIVKSRTLVAELEKRIY